MASQRVRSARPGARVAIGASAVAFVVMLVLAGCTQAKTSTAPPSSQPVAVPSSSASPSAHHPAVYYPKGSATENLPYFKKVGHALLDHDEGADGRKIVDYFVAAGFDKKNMEITPDKTSIGLQAWNIEFSVKLNGTCIIGQAGNVRFQSFAAPILATGKCLIGKTRTINW